MDQASSLQASFWFMVVMQTIGSVDMPGRGPRKLPSPRAYAAIIVTWGILQMLADAGGERAGRAAKVTAWVIVLVGMVLGPFGTTFVNFLSNSATSLAPTTPPTG
jgi:hypothetical protein